MGKLTISARTILDELNKLRWTSMFLNIDAQRAHERLNPEQQKKNGRYIEQASRILGIQQLTQSVDLYNWYCREVLKLAVISNPNEIITTLESAAGPIRDNIVRAKKEGRIPGAEIIERFCKPRGVSENAVRKSVHKHLGIFENPETKVLCFCRNALVHSLGKDEGGRIAGSLKEIGDERALVYPTNWPRGYLPIKLMNGGNLFIDYEIGAWATDLISNQVHLMDQNFSALHNLPTERWRPRPMSHCIN